MFSKRVAGPPCGDPLGDEGGGAQVAGDIRGAGRTSGTVAAAPSPLVLDPDLAKVVQGYTPAGVRAALEAREQRSSTGKGPSTDPTTDPTQNRPIRRSGSGGASDTEQRVNRERATGLEPATSSLGSWHSTN